MTKRELEKKFMEAPASLQKCAMKMKETKKEKMICCHTHINMLLKEGAQGSL